MTWVLFKDRCSWYLEFKSPKLTVSQDPTVTEIHADHMPVTFGNVVVVYACNVVVVDTAWPKPQSSSDCGPCTTPKIPSYASMGNVTIIIIRLINIIIILMLIL